MPTDTNLPTMVHLYFEVLERLVNWHEGFDSVSPEHKMFEEEARYYFDKIRVEMEKISKEEI